MRKIVAGLLAAVTVAGSVIAVPPAEARQRGIWRPSGHGAYVSPGPRRFAGPGYYRGGRPYGWYGRNRGWRGGYGWRPYRYGYYGYDGYDDGDAVAAGVAGLAVGAILGGALSHRHYHAGGSCAARFRSYNPATGTYLGYDGLRHPCP
ncbi:hypothetical protein LMIY3S_01006 [Labrys miyagiensis]